MIMATRRVYTDAKGPYFKGERFKFRHPVLEHAKGKVTHVGVSCGQASASAVFVVEGKEYFTSSSESQ
jgi:hypothetical protein